VKTVLNVRVPGRVGNISTDYVIAVVEVKALLRGIYTGIPLRSEN